MSTFVNLIAIITIIVTIGFIISVGAPFYIIVLVSLGLGGPLFCSLGAVLSKGD